MADSNATASSDGGGSASAGTEVKPDPAAATGADPANKTAPATQGFDPSTISDEDFTKVFSDPRTFTHPRFKALNEQAKEAEKLKAANEKAVNAQLEKDKEFETLAKKHEDSAKDWQSKYQTTLIDNKIQAEAAKLGITDFDAATKLIDRGGINISDDGVVNGVEDAVKALADTKSYLVDKSKQVQAIGSSNGNPADGNQTSTGSTRQFKASEISDPVFYKEHSKEIDASMKAGVPIIDDRNSTV